jgi:hypothetical protein
MQQLSRLHKRNCCVFPYAFAHYVCTEGHWQAKTVVIEFSTFNQMQHMKPYLLACVLMLSIVTIGQRYEIKTLGIIKDQKNTPDLVKYGNRYYGVTNAAKSKMGWTLKLEKIKYSNKLLAFDEQVNLYKETELEGGKETFGPFHSFLEVINDKLYYLNYNYTESTGIEVLAAEIDTASLKHGSLKKVISIDQRNVGLFKIMSLYSSYEFVVKVSPDKSKFLFLWIPGVNETFFYTVTDNKLNKLNSVSGTVQNATDLLLNNCIIDNAGNFFMGYKYEKKGKYYSGLVTSINGVIKQVPITLSEGSPHGAFVSAGLTDDHVRMYGTYSGDGYYINGGFSCTVDKNSLLVKGLLQKPIPEAMMNKFDKDSYAKTKKNDYGVYPEIYFVAKDLDDGNIIMAGDITRYPTVTTNGGPDGPISGPSLIVTFSKNDIHFYRLPKREGLGRGNNFYLHKWGSKAILLYPDLEDNLSKTIDEGEVTRFNSRKDNVVMAAVVQNDGRIHRQILNPSTPGKFYFSPSFAQSIADDAIIMGLGKDKYGLTSIRTTSQFYLLKILDE